MIEFVFHTLFLALSCVYLLFLTRVADGLKAVAAQGVAGDDPGGRSGDPGDGAQDGPAEPMPDAPAPPRVAVVVPARNEAASIARCLRSLAAQDYPAGRLAVLVADDESEDGTAGIAEAAVAGDERFRVLRSDGRAGKKAALERGIAASDAELILTTDADCTHERGWVAAMVRPLLRGADIAAGPVLYTEAPGLFARLQALEFLGIMGVGAGLFGIGAPRLCNGANLAYRREAYLRCGGHGARRAHPGGDDEFLLQRIVYAQGGRAAFTAEADAIVRTPPESTLRGFLRQRRRWASKGRRYEDRRYVAFLMVLFFYYLFAAAAPLAALLSLPSAALAAALLAVKWTAELRVLRTAARLFGVPLRARLFFAAALAHPPYIVAVSLAGLGGPVTWKHRTLATS